MSGRWQYLGERVAEVLRPDCSGELPQEVFCIDEGTAAVVTDIDGVDVILTVTTVPRQRPRIARR